MNHAPTIIKCNQLEGEKLQPKQLGKRTIGLYARFPQL